MRKSVSATLGRSRCTARTVQSGGLAAIRCSDNKRLLWGSPGRYYASGTAQTVQECVIRISSRDPRPPDRGTVQVVRPVDPQTADHDSTGRCYCADKSLIDVPSVKIGAPNGVVPEVAPVDIGA